MRFFLAACLAFGIAAPAHAFQVSRAPQIGTVEGSELYRARRIISRFLTYERRPECYRILFSSFEGNLRVDFVPRESPVLVLHENEPVPNLPERCGRNIGYVIDQGGRVIRRIYSR